ncbi:MAG TPA: hypothetical protein VGP69_03990 [Gaiellaceae bacterium]|nr:hypothetical protein [Gaiellaceae bacterium]
MRSKLLLTAAIGGLLVALPSAALGGAARTTANSTTFTDSTGEDASAPDITSVVVSNDDAGLITFKINISNRPALTPDMTGLIFLDTDQVATTGDPNSLGSDYAIELDPGSVGLFKWNGSTFVAAPSQASVTYSYDTTGATIRVSASELGKTKGLNFGVDVYSGITLDANGNPDFTNAHDDLAPDPGHGFFAYKVQTKLTLSVQAFTTSPKPAKHGKSFVAGLAITESDTGGPVQSGTVTCAATIATKHLAPLGHALKNGIAGCIWHLPITSKGKTIRGTVTVTVQGVKVSRSFSAKIT